MLKLLLLLKEISSRIFVNINIRVPQILRLLIFLLKHVFLQLMDLI